MIAGRVNWRLEAMIVVEIQDLHGNLHPFPCVLDTGYDGDLALPSREIDRLALVPSDELLVILGNGDHELMQVYDTFASWHEQLIAVDVLRTDNESVIGTALLENNTLTIQAWDGGDVLIEERE